MTLRNNSRGETVVRAAWGLILIALALTAIWFGGALYGGFVAGAALLASYELAGVILGRGAGFRRLPAPLLSGLTMALLLFLGETHILAALLGITLFVLLLSISADSHRPALANLLAVLYLGLLPASVIVLRRSGFETTLIGFGVIWASDIAAYFAGRAWGTVKIVRRVSPAKSLQGLIAGLLAGAAAGACLALALGLPAFRFGLIGLAVALGGFFGDLFESGLKREAGVKNSSDVIPGHGGVLDRVDALLFGLPLYMLLLWLWP